MATPIAARGETKLTLGSHELILKTSFAALVRIEERTGKEILPLVQSAFEKKIKLADVAAILFELASAGGSKLTYEEFGELLVTEGYINHAPAIYMALTPALTAGKKELKQSPKEKAPKEGPSDQAP